MEACEPSKYLTFLRVHGRKWRIRSGWSTNIPRNVSILNQFFPSPPLFQWYDNGDAEIFLQDKGESLSIEERIDLVRFLRLSLTSLNLRVASGEELS